MQSNKRKLFNKPKKIYPESNDIVISIENEYQFMLLMRAFDTVDICWMNNSRRASIGMPYRNKYKQKALVDYIKIEIRDYFDTHKDKEPNFYLRHGESLAHHLEHYPYLFYKPIFIDVNTMLVLISPTEEAEEYRRPNLPVL